MQEHSAPPVQAVSCADQAGVNPDPLKTQGADEVDKTSKMLDNKETLTVTELIMEVCNNLTTLRRLWIDTHTVITTANRSYVLDFL